MRGTRQKGSQLRLHEGISFPSILPKLIRIHTRYITRRPYGTGPQPLVTGFPSKPDRLFQIVGRINRWCVLACFLLENPGHRPEDASRKHVPKILQTGRHHLRLSGLESFERPRQRLWRIPAGESPEGPIEGHLRKLAKTFRQKQQIGMDCCPQTLRMFRVPPVFSQLAQEKSQEPARWKNSLRPSSSACFSFG